MSTQNAPVRAVIAGDHAGVEETEVCLAGLSTGHRPVRPRVLEGAAHFRADAIEQAIEAVPSEAVLWVWLCGPVRVHRRSVQLVTAERRGLDLDGLAGLLEERTGPTMLVLDIEGEVDAAREIEWPALALCAIGDGGSVRAALTAATGPVTAGSLGAAHDPTRLVHDGRDQAPQSAGAPALRAWRKARLAEHCDLPWARSGGMV